jgi:hypothetical protein
MDNERTIGGWTFFYNGWHRDFVEAEVSTDDLLHMVFHLFRSGALRGNMFPVDRLGSLNEETLTMLGLTGDRMKDDEGCPDALFFYQLLLLICDTRLKQ